MELSTETTTYQTAQAAVPRVQLWTRLLPYVLIAPTFILVALFTLWPAGGALATSFFSKETVSSPETFVGIQNYADLLDPAHVIGSQFPLIMGNTFIFAIATVVVSVPLALMLAILLNRAIRGLGLWRFAVFYPSLLPVIGAASIWAFLFANEIGLINSVLRSIPRLGTINWLGDPNNVLLAVIIVNIWKQTGYYMLFYLAGLQNVPKDIYEAGKLDGASPTQEFLFLTLPMLRRTTLFILVIAFTFAFQTVEQLQVLGQGNPGNRGNLLLYYIFQNRNEDLNAGHISAMTVVLTGIVLLFTVSNFVFFERGGREEGA